MSVFLACAVEAVEALTIVLAVGTTRSWSSAMGGVGAAGLVLALVVGILGTAVAHLPIDALRVAVGGLLLVFGLQWLRKAILRAAGLKPMHDERLVYRQERDAARAADGHAAGFDGYAFAVSFKGVLLEGFEVAFIVVTFGANQHRVGLAAVAAGVAVVFVAGAGVAARAPLARVPENSMKFAVGVMLSSFGMFWGAEGAGAHWPGGEAALPVIVLAVLLLALFMARRVSVDGLAVASGGDPEPENGEARGASGRTGWVAEGVSAVWEFVVGEDWPTAVGVALALALTAVLADGIGAGTWWVIVVASTGLLANSVRCAASAAHWPEGER